MPHGLERILAVVDAVYSREYPVSKEIAAIGISGAHRRFVVNRMGSTGSTWLARLLNSHPDVLCSHESIIGRVFPQRWYTSQDLVDLVRLLAADTLHGTGSDQ